jgi:hypothetical protein
MKKWMYVISVGGMLAVFLFFYFAHLKEMDIKDRQRAEEQARIAKAEAERKATIEAKAREDAERRAAERAAADAKKEADRLAKWEAQSREIQETTDKLNSEGEALAKQASELDVQLNALRTEKEKLNREAFELSKQVEQARIAKRNAELEIQRMTDMIAKRASDSSLARAPAPAPRS